MSLDDLRPANSKKARDSSVSAFKRFLVEENVPVSVVESAVRSDLSGATLIALMDRFGVYLAHVKAKDGTGLRRNTVGQYFRQTKLWLFDRFPQYRQLVDGAILAKGRILERYSGMRPGGKTVKQATACKKQDLYSLMSYIYSTATVDVDYQDAALLALLWYLFGRASDLAMVEKQGLSLCGDNMVFIRFLRMKTSEEQGLTLFPDISPVTCPLAALAIALVLQTAPSSALLPHLPQPTASDLAIHGPLVPLSEVLAGATSGRSLLEEALADGTTCDADEDEAPLRTGKAQASVPGIHAYVNRVLNRISGPALLKSALSSHSFRRGGAQHVNGKPGVSPHWIADRGGWNMTTTNKVFSYIFNTTVEDQKIAKMLSGHEADTNLLVLDLSHFDTTTKARVQALQGDLFACCTNLHDDQLNISPETSDVLFAYLIKSFPQHRSMNPSSPFVKRVEQALSRTGVELEQFMAWSMHLGNIESKPFIMEASLDSKHLQLIKHQEAVIDQLIDVNVSQGERLKELERVVGIAAPAEEPTMPQKRKQDQSPEEKQAKRKRKSTDLWQTWYAWYAGRAFSTEEDRQWKSTMRRCVLYMLLFADSLDYDEEVADFRDVVLADAHALQAKVQAFFLQYGATTTSTGSAQKKLRELQNAGALNTLIANFDTRVRVGLIRDITPLAHQGERLKPGKIVVQQ